MKRGISERERERERCHEKFLLKMKVKILLIGGWVGVGGGGVKEGALEREAMKQSIDPF